MIPPEAVAPIALVFMLTGFLIGVFVGARYFDFVALDEEEKE